MNSWQKYLDPQHLAKLQGLPLRARTVVEGYLAGLHRSPYRGFSVEFAQHREYSPGDDLRYVDWKVFGRTDKIYLKQYEEETNQICYFVLDVSASMTYRSEPAPLTKLEYAKCAVAALAYLALLQNDAVAFASYDWQLREWLSPAGTAAHLDRLLTVVDRISAGEHSSAKTVFYELAQRFRKRGLVIILSDLLDNVDELLAGLKYFRFRRHDVIVFQILDPAEVDFPFSQLAQFRALEGTAQVLVDPRAIRRAYLAALEKHTRTLAAGCRLHKIDYQLLRTDQPLGLALAGYLARRAKLRW
ncbi:MAG: DUF58 domain-containing protein [Thermoguttaceae bacterium]|nr:DUF58 domain-containing protein [Thermoguttaceae bacterium]MDW8078039.1 DUF58 domain-containing protein [Thermoguttaceae bacterium]